MFKTEPFFLYTPVGFGFMPSVCSAVLNDSSEGGVHVAENVIA